MNLNGWKYILTYGSFLDVYAKGNNRVIVDKNSGRVVARYVIDNKNAKGGTQDITTTPSDRQRQQKLVS